MAMLSLDELKHKISHRHVVIDTNLLIEAYNKIEVYKEIFDFLQEAKCIPVLPPFISFEFLSEAHQLEYRRTLEKFLASLNFIPLPLTQPKELFEQALEIAHKYSARKMSPPGLVDSCLAALLERHKGDLFLITRNHKHFSGLFLDRLFIWPIGLNNEVVSMAFYEFPARKRGAL